MAAVDGIGPGEMQSRKAGTLAGRCFLSFRMRENAPVPKAGRAGALQLHAPSVDGAQGRPCLPPSHQR